MFNGSTIRQATRALAITVTATFLVAALVIAFALSQIRLGGTLDRHDRLNAEFLGDILPPPLFLVEPMLHATWLVADPELADEQIAELNALEKTYRARLAYWQASDLKPELKQQVVEQLVPLGEKFWTKVNTDLIPATKTGDRAQIEAAHDRFEQTYRDYKARIDDLVVKADRANSDQLTASTSVSTWTMAALAALTLILLAQLIWAMKTLNRRALVPLGETAGTMTRMAGGDLDAGQTQDHRPDEIGEMTRAIEVFRAASRKQQADAQVQHEVVEALRDALARVAEGQLGFAIERRFAAEYEPLRETFNRTVARLAALIREVAESARGVRNGAAEILSASDDLAQRNERQAGSVEETAAAMRQVSGSVAESARSTAGVRDTIGATHAEVVEGGHTVERMVAAMTEIEQSSREINQIIAVIEGIAFQTNLLALNAGVEAARAGEAGKGFAVVANEVRALAQRSSDAAREISTLIGKSTLRVGEGVALVGDTGRLLTTVVDRMSEINASVGAIAESSTIQAANLEQVTGSVSEMDRVTQQNAAMVEETTAAARSLAQGAERLAGLVARFDAGDGAGAVHAATPASSPSRPARRIAAAPRPALAVGHDATDWSEF